MSNYEFFRSLIESNITRLQRSSFFLLPLFLHLKTYPLYTLLSIVPNRKSDISIILQQWNVQERAWHYSTKLSTDLYLFHKIHTNINLPLKLNKNVYSCFTGLWTGPSAVSTTRTSRGCRAASTSR